MEPIIQSNQVPEKKHNVPSQTNNAGSQKTEINPDNINATINEMIKDSNVLSAFELNEKNLQFLKELRRFRVIKINVQRMRRIRKQTGK
jgi:hypothetical protein